MKPIHTLRVSVEEALGYSTGRDSLRENLVDIAWEEAAQAVPNFQALDDAGDVGETTVRLDGVDFVVTVHDLREEGS